MDSLAIDWRHSGLNEEGLLALQPRLAEEIARLNHAAYRGYETEYASINLPLDSDSHTISRRLAKEHKDASLVVVVGIGGSNLGTLAVQEALLGRHHNLLPGKRPRILYADTVDPAAMQRIVRLVDDELRSRRHVVINAVSKSGATTETIANLEVLLAALKRRRRDPRKHVVVTTDEGSLLWQLAAQEGYALLPIPKKVGGRYSVLSCNGLFPLALLGIDTGALLDGAAHMRAQCLKERDNPAAIRAAILVNALRDGRNIADNFYFATDLEGIGKWYRQLMGESIGKEWDRRHDRRIWAGMTPTVSIGSTDLHSMAQLYFGGPDDKLFTIVTADRMQHVAIPRLAQYDPLVQNIQGKDLATIMRAISSGVQSTLRKQGRPYCAITLPALDARSIGALLQLHMMEMMLLAALLDVNAFDQPNVEDYKAETRKILARERDNAKKA